MRGKQPRQQFGKQGKRTTGSRNKENKNPLPRVLIVCEGKTESGYFKTFRPLVIVRSLDIRPEGRNTLSLVQRAKNIEDQEGTYDEVWCVFDRDDFAPSAFDNAIQSIESTERYNAAYSNEAFELWFVLHFEYVDTKIKRNAYNEKLTTRLGRRYEKGNKEIYLLIQQNGNEEQAIRWADQLTKQHTSETPPSQRCPETTVYKLIQQLRQWQRESIEGKNSGI